ncbi:MAG: hypothetical protein ACYC0T_16230 [Ramlibacter sp.]
MLIKTMAGVLVLLALAACDLQRVAELEEGVSTEADVRASLRGAGAIQDGAAPQHQVRRRAPPSRTPEAAQRND